LPGQIERSEVNGSIARVDQALSDAKRALADLEKRLATKAGATEIRSWMESALRYAQ